MKQSYGNSLFICLKHTYTHTNIIHSWSTTMFGMGLVGNNRWTNRWMKNMCWQPKVLCHCLVGQIKRNVRWWLNDRDHLNPSSTSTTTKLLSNSVVNCSFHKFVAPYFIKWSKVKICVCVLAKIYYLKLECDVCFAFVSKTSKLVIMLTTENWVEYYREDIPPTSKYKLLDIQPNRKFMESIETREYCGYKTEECHLNCLPVFSVE